MASTDNALTLADVRTAIDVADDILLRAIAKRLEAVALLKPIKHAKGLSVSDPAREDELRSRWKKNAMALGLRPELALLFLDILLDESKRLQHAS